MKLEAHWELPEYRLDEFRPKATKYCVLIPVLNEGERIRTQLKRMAPLAGLADAFIVDGGSTDGSLAPAYLKENGVRALLTKTGPGKLSAQMRLGLAYGMSEGYEGIILIDGNNKDNPEAIPDFIRLLDEGYDHIQGSRFVPGGQAINNPASRLWGIKLLHAPLISLAAGVRYTDTTNGFRAYSRKFLLAPKVRPFRNVFSQYELHYYLSIKAGNLGFKVTETPVARVYPADGTVPTKISGFKGNWLVLKTLFKACFHLFDPEERETATGAV